MRAFAAFALALVAGSGLAQGDTRETSVVQANVAFLTGDYGEAARLALGEARADGYALAARARLAEAMCASTLPPTADLSEAEALARQALALEPGHVEGRLQLAIALSLRTRGLSAMAAWRSGLGGQARELVEAVLVDDPGNAYAHGFLAVWHLEVLHRGGPMGASVMGASREAALRHYGLAAWLSPDDAALHWQVARALAAGGPVRHRAEIDAALERALAARTDSALEAVMAERAGRLKAVLAEGDGEAARRLAEALL